ncbi:MAG: pur operon repressor [Clostridia bacterium]
MKRNQRIGAIIKILTESPNEIYTLSHFCEMFGAAKSTISEDMMIIREIFQRFHLGEIQTIAGAAGGAKYLPIPLEKDAYRFIQNICSRLSDPHRILPGGFLYMVDMLTTPKIAQRIGEILASQFYKARPDFVVTVETKGISIALMTARALNVPMVIARRDNRITEGSLVTINYLSGSARRFQTMSLAKRAVKEGQKALIVDDFMKGGGTAKGMIDLMKEFSVTVVGIGIVVATKHPEKKLVDDYISLITMKDVDEYQMKVDLEPADWLAGK